MYFKYVTEKQTQIKSDLANKTVEPNASEVEFAKLEGNLMHSLVSSILKISNLQPFMCEIEDLNQKIDLAKFRSRAIILPFALKFESHERIACVKQKILDLLKLEDT